MLYIRFFILSFLLCFTQISGNVKIPQEDAAVLTPFFRTLLENTEAGYVLFDKKPVCIQAFSKNYLHFQKDFDKLSIAICNAQEKLEKQQYLSKNIYFRINQDEGYILALNRNLFLKAVRENLSLFQYVLGPCLTPENLLNTLLENKKSFNEVFNNDKVLVGIILGYGTQNSLFVGRMENIMYSTFAVDSPPYFSTPNFYNEFEKEIFFKDFDEQFADHAKNLKPSFGFLSLSEEQEKLKEKIDLPPTVLTDQNPTFIFGSLKDAENNERLFSELVETQSKILDLTRSPLLLCQVLERIFEEEIEVEINELPAHPLFACTSDINLAMAKLLKAHLYDFESKSISDFSKGLVDIENSFIIHACHNSLGFPETIRNIRAAKKNLEATHQFFKKLSKNRKFVSPVENLLCYRVLKKGDGPRLEKETQIQATFEIFDSMGRSLKEESKTFVDLEQTIPGFAHGIKGMQIGEKREIYIHPALAYGIETWLEKGTFLKAIVELIEIHDTRGNWPSLTPKDLAFLEGDEYLQNCEHFHEIGMLNWGKAKGEFLKECPGIDVEIVAKQLIALKETDELSQEEIKSLHHFFWNLYFH